MQHSDNLPAINATKERRTSKQSPCLIVFVGKADCRILKFLKPGFRHCFVAFRANDRWVICDSLKKHIEFSVVNLPLSFDLSEFYRKSGHTVFAGHLSENGKLGSILPEILTCVTVAKRILGIRSFWTFTPWQLFCLLSSMRDQWHLVK